MQMAKSKFNVGVQVKYYSTDTIELTAAYDVDVRQDYTAHSGLIRAGMRF